MPEQSLVPVTVLTGYLGAGKTTLLNRILTENHGKKYAVVINEFGELGVDNDLVVDSDEEVFEMNNGCICCTVRGDLVRILGKKDEPGRPMIYGTTSEFLNFFGLIDVPTSLRAMVVHACGRLTGEETVFVPESERRKVFRTARLWVAIYVVTIAAAIVFTSWLPLVLIGGPRIYGAFMFVIYGLTQHAGMGENVLDHRLNTRTVKMGPINRFLYWNMNYHIEHHMFPMVPFYALPKLHALIKDQCPAPYRGLFAAYCEIVPAIIRQRRDPTWFISRRLPGDGRPVYANSVTVAA